MLQSLDASPEEGASYRTVTVGQGDEARQITYKQIRSEQLSGTTGAAVTAKPLMMEGYTFQTGHPGNVLTGEIIAGEEPLTMVCFYDREKYIIPKYTHLEKLALETVGRKDFEMLDVGGKPGATQAFIREMLRTFLAERAEHMNGR